MTTAAADQFGVVSAALSLAYGTVEALRRILKYRAKMALRQRSISKRDIGVGPEQGDLEYGRAPRRSTETVLESCSYDLECFTYEWPDEVLSSDTDVQSTAVRTRKDEAEMRVRERKLPFQKLWKGKEPKESASDSKASRKLRWSIRSKNH